MWTSDETVVTTTSITTVSESIRRNHSEWRSPKLMNEKNGTRASCPAKTTSKKAYHDSTQVMTRKVEVTSMAGSEPAAAGSCTSSWPCASSCVFANAAWAASGDGAP